MVRSVARDPEATPPNSCLFGDWEIRMVRTERVSLFHLVLLSLGLAFLAGCPTNPGGSGDDLALDLSGLGTAQYGEAYSGEIGVTDYDGAARFELNSGTLPEGLDLNEAGQVSGTPTYAGTYEFEVLVSGLSVGSDFSGSASITVDASDVAGVFWGYDHDQYNNMTEQYQMMKSIWVRQAGVGVTETQSWTMNAGIYLPGTDGTAEEGAGDDERIGDIAFSELSIQVGDAWVAIPDLDGSNFDDLIAEEWVPTEQPNTYPQQGYPSVHMPEGEPPTIGADGTFAGGVDAGEARIRLYHPDYENVITVQYQIVPPDWCPNGQHEPAGGGNPGVCE